MKIVCNITLFLKLPSCAYFSFTLVICHRPFKQSLELISINVSDFVLMDNG